MSHEFDESEIGRILDEPFFEKEYSEHKLSIMFSF